MAQQATSIQLALRGAAQTWAINLPQEIMTRGGIINGRQTDPISYIVHCLSQRWGQPDDERAAMASHRLLNFQANHGEGLDSILTRFDVVREEAENAGMGLGNFRYLTMILLNALSLPPDLLEYCLLYTSPSPRDRG